MDITQGTQTYKCSDCGLECTEEVFDAHIDEKNRRVKIIADALMQEYFVGDYKALDDETYYKENQTDWDEIVRLTEAYKKVAGNIDVHQIMIGLVGTKAHNEATFREKKPICMY